MQVNNPIALLRTLKGAPLSILLALAMEKQPVMATWLETATGYSDKPVMTGLKVLKELRFVTQNSRYAWQLANEVRQLPFIMDLLEEDQPPALPMDDPALPEPPQGQHDSENLRLGEIPSQSLASRLQNPESRKEIDPLPDSSAADTEILRVLDSNNIREPARSKLANLPHISARLIRYHCTHAPNSGLAIYRIKQNWPIPDDYLTHQADMPPIDSSQESPPDIDPLPPDFSPLWLRAVDQLAAEIPRVHFDTWCAGNALQPAGFQNGELLIKAANPYAAAWHTTNIRTRLEELLQVHIHFT